MIHLDKNVDGNVPYGPDYINYTNMTNEYNVPADYILFNFLAFGLLCYAFGGVICKGFTKCKDNVRGYVDRSSLSDYLLARETEVTEGSDDPCSICLEEFVISNKIIVLACEHKFHSDCIKSWISQESICPLCRQEISMDMN